MSRKPVWVGDRLYDLLTLSLSELKKKYPEYTPGTLKGKKAYWSNKYRNGEIDMPPTPENQPENQPERHEVKEYIEDGHLVSEVTGWYEMVTKNAEGEAEVHKLYKHSTKKRPLPEDVSEALFVSQAAPTSIHPIEVVKSTRTDSISLIAGDAQIGYRGEEPFHDDRAMDLFLQVARDLQPDNIIFTGDMIDLPAQSRWEQRPDWLMSTQASIDRYHRFLAEVRANSPNSRVVVVHGNHEARMDKMVRSDAASLLGLRRANAERELAVLTLPFLVRYEELGVEMVDGYPNAALWLEDNLKVTHGTNVKKGGSNAAKYLQEEDETTIYGHTHRVELAYRTIATRLGSRTIAAASPGCLARTDGYVPGFHYSVDAQAKTVPKSEDWQKGLLIVHHSEKSHDIEAYRMRDDEDGVTIRINNKEYRA